MTFSQLIQKRYACKLFTNAKIPQHTLEAILEAGRLAPSSCGFEPWKFIVISQEADNKHLSTLCYNQQNVATASHNIIILARTDVRAQDAFAQQQIRRFVPNDEAKFNEVLHAYTSPFQRMSEVELLGYAEKNCYLPLMQMALAATSEGVNSCMIGGFEKARVDSYLGLQAPFQTAVILSLGYEAAPSTHGKKRLALDSIVEYR